MSDFDLGALEIALATDPDRDALLAAVREVAPRFPGARADMGILAAAAALDPDLADWLRGACELDRDQRLGTLRAEDLPERLRLLGRSGVKAGIPVDLVLDALDAMERDIGGDA